MFYGLVAYSIGVLTGTLLIVYLAWLEVQQKAVNDRYVALPHVQVVPYDKWLAWLKEKDRTKTAEAGMSAAEVYRSRNRWLLENGYRAVWP